MDCTTAAFLTRLLVLKKCKDFNKILGAEVLGKLSEFIEPTDLVLHLLYNGFISRTNVLVNNWFWAFLETISHRLQYLDYLGMILHPYSQIIF